MRPSWSDRVGRLLELLGKPVPFAIVMALALLVRLPGLGMPGTLDVDEFLEDGANVVDHGASFYDHARSAYPPLAYYAFGLAETAARATGLSRIAVYNAVFCLWLAIALWPIFAFVSGRAGASRGRLAVLLIWANPAVILYQPYLGYMADPMFGSLVAGALICATGGRFLSAGTLYGLALSAKPTAAIFLPPLAVFAVASGGRLGLFRAAIATGYAAAMTYVPLLLGGVRAVWWGLAVTLLLLKQDYLSAQALNLFWITQWMAQVRDAANRSALLHAMATVRTAIHPRGAFAAHWGVPYAVLSVGLFAPITVWLAVRLWRRLTTTTSDQAVALFETVSLQLLAYFIFFHSVHENHLYSFMLFWPIVVALSPSGRECARFCALAGFSALCAIDVVAFYGIGSRGPADVIAIAWIRPAAGVDTTVVYSLLAVAATLWQLARASRASEPRGAGDGSAR